MKIIDVDAGKDVSVIRALNGDGDVFLTQKLEGGSVTAVADAVLEMADSFDLWGFEIKVNSMGMGRAVEDAIRQLLPTVEGYDPIED